MSQLPLRPLIILIAPDTQDKPRAGRGGQGSQRVTSGPKCQAGDLDFTPRARDTGKVPSRTETLLRAFFTLDRARSESEEARLDGGRGKGLLLRPRPPPQISVRAAAPTGVEEALPHSKGCNSRMSWPAPAPRGCPAGITGPGKPWALSQTPTTGPFSSVFPAPTG